ncbi:hypothetical protein [Roseobacter sp. S98]|uniref:hypothetical protein n=1 Tax=Roseobacter algicola (ex Choi et al. 2025) (nom. illeg.) TaxID=3092138 RepID=UPI0035C67BFF
MLELAPNLLAHLQARGARNAQLLVWITARDRTSGNPVSVGFWTGADHRILSIGGVQRTYYGAGALLKVAPLVSNSGVSVRITRLTFSPVSEELRFAVRGYETKDAPVEIHIANFDPLTGVLIAEPLRRFKGFVKGLSFPRPAVGDEALCEVSVKSAAEVLTRTLPLKKSQAALEARLPGDGFRRHAEVSGSIETVWGERRSGTAGGA